MSLGNQSREGQFCKLVHFLDDNPFTESSQRRWANNTWRCETWQWSSDHLSCVCVSGVAQCLIGVSCTFLLHTALQLSQVCRIWFCALQIHNWQLTLQRIRWWSRSCNEWGDPEISAPLAAKYANIKWSVANLWCCSYLRGPGLHSIIEKIWIRNRNNRANDLTPRDMQHRLASINYN